MQLQTKGDPFNQRGKGVLLFHSEAYIYSTGEGFCRFPSPPPCTVYWPVLEDVLLQTYIYILYVGY